MLDSVMPCIRAAACGLALTLSTPVSAETRALLAGVWKFGSAQIPDLQGPENDLVAVEALMRGQGAKDITVMRNDAVTRTGFETALHAMGLRSKPGDWIFIYYSGHGALADAAVKGTSDGETDQFLPLAGFDPDRQDPERFIVDKDIYAWIARYVPREVQVLMIADACHSGTLHRSVDPRAWRFTPRLALRGDATDLKLVARPAPRFASVLAGGEEPTAATRADLANNIYIGAALDDQLALEASLPAEGAPSRGLLTYAFEQALTTAGADGKSLAADADRDGKVQVGELAVYLNGQVRAMTGQRQESSAHFVSGADRLALFETIVRPPPQVSLARPLPAVHISGGALEPSPSDGWRLAPSATKADFVWDVTSGSVLRRSGDVVAQRVQSRAALAGVVEKWTAMDTLRPFLAEGAGKVTIGPGRGDERHKPGTVVKVGLTLGPATAARFATVFNLASDGTVQRLYPLSDDGDGRVLPGTTLPLFDSRVVAPFGTDHVVAVITPAAPTALRDILRTTDGQRGAGRAAAAVKATLATGGPSTMLSVGELYTGN